MFAKLPTAKRLSKLCLHASIGVLLCCAGAAQAEHADAKKTYIVDLPRLSLDRSLTQLARQTHISVDFSSSDLKHVNSKPILGLYTLEEALGVVLKGSQYSYQKVGTGAYRIIPAPVVTPTPDKKHQKRKAASTPLSSDVIIVRATKRAGVASRLPMSLSVMDSEQLDVLGITDTNALALHTAGMSSTNLGPSRNKIFIRGISDGSFTGRQQATIGAYLDNIRLNYNEPDPYLQLDDVDHVEVLRGPQGTLYGAGSLGGLYRVITNAPDLETYSAKVSLGVSQTKNGGQNGRVSATINMPLVEDKLAFRITGYLDHSAGYIDDIQLGLKNVNTTDVFGTRARILLNVGESWEVNAGLNFQDVISDDTQYFLSQLGSYQRSNFVREPHEDDYINPYAEVKGRFGWGEVVTSTAFVHRSIGDQIDASLAVPLLAPLPVTPSGFNRERKISMITNETRLVSRLGGNLDWLVGAFVSQRRENFTSKLTIPNSSALLPGGDRNGDVAFSEARKERTNEVAFFGETTWHLPFDVDLTGGLRWFLSDEHTRANIDGSLGTASVTRLGQSRDSGYTPKAVLSYQYNDHTLLYGQVSQGYRVGGINLNSPDSVFFEVEEGDEGDGSDQIFEPDKLTMYEVGGKFSFLNDKLQIHVAAFTFKWNDIQTDQILPDGFTFILNAGYVRSRGVDMDILFEPFSGFTLDANLSFNDPDLVIANPFLGSQVNDHLPGIPTLAGGLIAEYNWDAGHGRQWYLSGDYTYTGTSQLTFASVDNRDAEQSNIINFRLALEQPGRWQVTAYARNILNEKANTFAFGNPFSFRQSTHHTPPVPLTVGVSFKKHF